MKTIHTRHQSLAPSSRRSTKSSGGEPNQGSIHAQMHTILEQATWRRPEPGTEQCEQQITECLHRAIGAVGTGLIRLDGSEPISVKVGHIPKVLTSLIQQLCLASHTKSANQLTVHKESRLAITVFQLLAPQHQRQSCLLFQLLKQLARTSRKWQWLQCRTCESVSSDLSRLNPSTSQNECATLLI